MDWNAEDRDELLATADESLETLAHLVANLLDMSRLEAGVLSVFPRPVGLDEIVARSLDDLGPAGRTVGVDIPDSVPEVLADPGILERVIVNLTSNALRYSPDGDPPLLTASSLGDRVELLVIDRGPGIPEADRMPDIRPVPAARRHRQHHRRRPGAGPVPRLRRGHGRLARSGGDAGRRADHDPLPAGGQHGSRRRRAPIPAGGSAMPGRRSMPGRAGDSDAQGARGGRRAADPAGAADQPAGARQYEVCTAATGTEALDVAAKHPPDLVVLDLGLPGLDGLDVIQGLRGWTSVPIIVLSGRADSTDKVEALDAGADDYVTKPFGMEELLARMRAAARRAHGTDGLPRVRLGRLTVDLAAKRVSRGGRRRGRGHPPHPHRVAPARGAAAQSRQAAHPAGSCSTRCGGPATRTPRATCGCT